MKHLGDLRVVSHEEESLALNVPVIDNSDDTDFNSIIGETLTGDSIRGFDANNIELGIGIIDKNYSPYPLDITGETNRRVEIRYKDSGNTLKNYKLKVLAIYEE